ncbi:unnamed protein product, partial [Amoebophrya sp. A25]
DTSLGSHAPSWATIIPFTDSADPRPRRASALRVSYAADDAGGGGLADDGGG